MFPDTVVVWEGNGPTRNRNENKFKCFEQINGTKQAKVGGGTFWRLVMQWFVVALTCDPPVSLRSDTLAMEWLTTLRHANGLNSGRQRGTDSLVRVAQTLE